MDYSRNKFDPAPPDCERLVHAFYRAQSGVFDVESEEKADYRGLLNYVSRSKDRKSQAKSYFEH